MIVFTCFLALCFVNFSAVKTDKSANFKDLHDFKSFLLLKKLEVQSEQTYSNFKENFTKMFLKNEIQKTESSSARGSGVSGATKEQGDQVIDEVKLLISSSGPIEDPQIQFGRLAFLYTAMNRADLAAANSIKRVCTVDGLMHDDSNSNLCGTYSEYLVKLIELRIGIITSRIMYANGILGIPRGWVAHVQGIVKELQAHGMLNDSMKHLNVLLTAVSNSNEEIDIGMLPNVLSPKAFNGGGSGNALENAERQRAIVAATPQTANVTVDATHLTRQLTENLRAQQETKPQFDSTLTGLVPGMLVL